jgi:hypothetical protein
MTPTLGEILTGNARVIAGLATEDGGVTYASARLGVVAMLSILAAQEAEAGVAVRVRENRTISALLTDAAADYPIVTSGEAEAGDLTLAALDAINATLRRHLMALHEAVEAAGDTRRDRAILALYCDMARAHRLTLPG